MIRWLKERWVTFWLGKLKEKELQVEDAVAHIAVGSNPENSFITISLDGYTDSSIFDPEPYAVNGSDRLIRYLQSHQTVVVDDDGNPHFVHTLSHIYIEKKYRTVKVSWRQQR